MRQGADWGFSVDPSVLVQCAIVGQTLYVPHEAYMVGCEIDMLPTLFGRCPSPERWPIDRRQRAARDDQLHAPTRLPASIVPAIKGARSLEEGVEFLQSFEIVVHPRCTHTIDELTAYSYKLDPLTQAVLPVLNDKDNHVIDALRYACEGARRALRAKEQEVKVAPVPVASPWRQRR
jgi:phage terminase large subunit